MIDRQYQFVIGDKVEVFFTNESQIEFYSKDTDKKLFTIDPEDLAVVQVAYNVITAMWTQYDAEDETRDLCARSEAIDIITKSTCL